MSSVEENKKKLKAILLPGNGCDDSIDVMWYPYIAEQCRLNGIDCELRLFPDPLFAHESIWKQFAFDELGLDENTILIGHSSGAACSLRLMEERKVFGCLLVAAYDSDLGDETERESGYFDRDFDYEKMRANSRFIVQFHSTSDHLVPVDIARRVAKSLKPTEYIETKSDGHFQRSKYPIFIDALIRNVKKLEVDGEKTTSATTTTTTTTKPNK